MPCMHAKLSFPGGLRGKGVWMFLETLDHHMRQFPPSNAGGCACPRVLVRVKSGCRFCHDAAWPLDGILQQHGVSSARCAHSVHACMHAACIIACMHALCMHH